MQADAESKNTGWGIEMLIATDELQREIATGTIKAISLDTSIFDGQRLGC